MRIVSLLKDKTFNKKMSNISEALTIYTKCINFSAIKHKEQRRFDAAATPYINHPIGVAHILSAEGKISDLATLEAAILHDTVEDTDTTFEEIEEHFGLEVRKLVEEVTDDKNLRKAQRKQAQIDHAKETSYKAKLVKLADKIYNLRDLQKSPPKDWTKERCIEYFIWSKKVVDNLRGTNKELEDALDVLFKEEGII